MGFLKGKRALITGVASGRSIAWGIAQAMRHQGADIALTYQNETLRGRVQALAEQDGCKLVLPCDVGTDDSIEAMFESLSKAWTRLDAVVHSIAFAPREELKESFVDNTSRKGFLTAHEISSYSLAALAKHVRPLMRDNGGSIITLSYLGAERAVPNYNVMGLAKASLEANVRYLAAELGADNIRVNCISSGPIRTLAASGIQDFRKMLEYTARVSPLKRNVSAEEVGNVGAFLASDLASGITGETIHVDAGFNIVGLAAV